MNDTPARRQEFHRHLDDALAEFYREGEQHGENFVRAECETVANCEKWRRLCQEVTDMLARHMGYEGVTDGDMPLVIPASSMASGLSLAMHYGLIIGRKMEKAGAPSLEA